MIQYFILLIVVIISGVSLLSYNPSDKDGELIYEILKILIPGISFSIFVLILQLKHLTIIRFITALLFLVLGYFINFYLGLASWGIAAPFVGGLGGIMINIAIIKEKNPAYQDYVKFFLIGCISSFIGLMYDFSTMDNINTGIGYAAIMIPWQIAVGIGYIEKIKKLND